MSSDFNSQNISQVFQQVVQQSGYNVQVICDWPDDSRIWVQTSRSVRGAHPPLFPCKPQGNPTETKKTLDVYCDNWLVAPPPKLLVGATLFFRQPGAKPNATAVDSIRGILIISGGCPLILKNSRGGLLILRLCRLSIFFMTLVDTWDSRYPDMFSANLASIIRPGKGVCLEHNGTSIIALY